VIPKCGHVPQIEQPDAFVAALAPFIAAQQQQRKTA
jgi:pimeloyl-ACP methyl ester carboxylesterase